MSHGTIDYFSVFSGIGGFEIGIERAMASINRTTDRGSETSSAREQSQRERLVPEAGQASRASNGRSGYCTPNIAYTRTPTCVGYSEIDKYALQIYRHHFPTHTNFGDIAGIDEAALPDFDLLVGGFPCQAFSIAGMRRGFEDTRGTLFFDIARILRAKKPGRFLLENVRGLLSHDGGATFKTIIAALVELGYGVEWQVLNSKNHGVPQNRERVFIVGYLGGQCARQVFPLGVDGRAHQAVRSADCDRSRRDDQSAIRRFSERRDVRFRRLTPTECERLQGFPDGWTRYGVEGEISDTQRYKTLGNAVTVNVITAIMMELAHGHR